MKNLKNYGMKFQGEKIYKYFNHFSISNVRMILDCGADKTTIDKLTHWYKIPCLKN